MVKADIDPYRARSGDRPSTPETSPCRATGPSVRRERRRSPPRGWLRLSRSRSQWSTGGRLRPQGRSAESGFRLDIDEDAYSGLPQRPLARRIPPFYGRLGDEIDAREEKLCERWRRERI